MPPVSATDRVNRILAIVPWLADRQTASIAELCERFAVTERELMADLAVVPMVGRYPYSPDNLIEVIVDDGEVSLTYGNFFERPLRLSRAEALAVLTTARAAAAIPGHDPDGPLARGVAKIADALDVSLDDDLEVVVEPPDPAILELLRDAVGSNRVVTIDHVRVDGERTDGRSVEPWRVFTAEGEWYLQAHCRTSDDERVFRLDGIQVATVTDERFDPPGTLPPPAPFSADPDLPRVRLRLTPDGAWAAERYPVEDRVDHADGTVDVSMAVASTAFLERLLVQLGPAATVIDGPAGLRDCGAQAAKRLLSMYR